MKRSQLEAAPASLDELREPLREFLIPMAEAVRDGRTPDEHWSAPGPWRQTARQDA